MGDDELDVAPVEAVTPAAEPGAVTRPAPTAGADDELMPDPPAGAPPGGLDGYRAGRKVFFAIAGVMVIAVIGLGWTANRWRDAREAERRAPKLPDYALSSDVDDLDRPRQLVWSDGVARLGLAREQPGVQEIVLPDKRIRLAPGHDIAQIKVEVREGRTVHLAVLVGRIVELPPRAPQAEDAAPQSPPAAPATAQ